MSLMTILTVLVHQAELVVIRFTSCRDKGKLHTSYLKMLMNFRD